MVVTILLAGKKSMKKRRALVSSPGLWKMVGEGVTEREKKGKEVDIN